MKVEQKNHDRSSLNQWSGIRSQRSGVSNRTSEVGRQRKDNRAEGEKRCGIDIYSLLEIIAGVGVVESVV